MEANDQCHGSANQRTRLAEVAARSRFALFRRGRAISVSIFLRRGSPNITPDYLSKEALRLSIPEKSIAVMPFENLSADQQNSFFADGVQDEILTDLAKIADLKVISRTV